MYTVRGPFQLVLCDNVVVSTITIVRNSIHTGDIEEVNYDTYNDNIV